MQGIKIEKCCDMKEISPIFKVDFENFISSILKLKVDIEKFILMDPDNFKHINWNKVINEIYDSVKYENFKAVARELTKTFIYLNDVGVSVRKIITDFTLYEDVNHYRDWLIYGFFDGDEEAHKILRDALDDIMHLMWNTNKFLHIKLQGIANAANLYVDKKMIVVYPLTKACFKLWDQNTIIKSEKEKLVFGILKKYMKKIYLKQINISSTPGLVFEDY
jgi:hypothetical protein